MHEICETNSKMNIFSETDSLLSVFEVRSKVSNTCETNSKMNISLRLVVFYQSVRSGVK